jgi:ABC-type phosphate transport system auxiliary subunit
VRCSVRLAANETFGRLKGEPNGKELRRILHEQTIRDRNGSMQQQLLHAVKVMLDDLTLSERKLYERLHLSRSRNSNKEDVKVEVWRVS